MIYYSRSESNMKIFDKYFQPYAEYCLRTVFSEDELKAVFEKEFPAYNDLFPIIKNGGNANDFTFFRKQDLLQLHPGIKSRNSLRGGLLIQCEKSEYPSETILHITIVGHSGWLFRNTSLICHDAANIFTNSSKENPFPA